jgi:hypothetical protein
VPSGKKGLDYEFEAVLDGQVVACEVKCKVEGSSLGASAIKSRLNEAREQLPTDRPSIVFLKIPEEWALDPNVKSQVDAALNDVFLRSGRISAIIIRYELWDALANGAGKALKVAHETFHNPKARLSLSKFGKILARPFKPNSWRSIPDILDRPQVRIVPG